MNVFSQTDHPYRRSNGSANAARRTPGHPKWTFLVVLLICMICFALRCPAQTPHPTDPNAIANGENKEASWKAEVEAEASRGIRSAKNLVYRTADETEVTADLFRPNDDQVYPLVLMIHGGGWISGDKWDLRDHARELAQAGFVVCSINYRLAPKVKMWTQLEDVKFAARWASDLASEWKADPTRTAVWGYSAGAHLGSLLALMPNETLTRYTNREQPEQLESSLTIRAVVAGGAPCDFDFVPEGSFLLAPVLGGTRKRKYETYLDFSPIEYVSATDANERELPAFFFFHGNRDALVPMSTSKRMYAKLQEQEADVEYHLVDGKGHLFSFLDLRVRRLAIQFLRRHLTVEASSPTTRLQDDD